MYQSHENKIFSQMHKIIIVFPDSLAVARSYGCGISTFPCHFFKKNYIIQKY
jgi:hypothetical protein